MIQIKFTKKATDKLFDEFEMQEHKRVRKKLLALYLKALEFKHKDIERICRISRPTLAAYLKDYNESGIHKLKEINFYKPTSELMNYKAQVKKHFDEHPPISLIEANEKIKKITGIKRGLTQTGVFLKKIGMKSRKVGFIPGNSDDPDKQKEQEAFKKNFKPQIKRGKGR